MIRSLFAIMSTTLLMFAFQNCSDVEFEPSPAAVAKADAEQGPEVTDEVVEQIEQEEDLGDGDNDGDDGQDVGDDGDEDGDDGDEDGDENLREKYACNQGNETGVMVCHIPPGNPAAKHTICIGAPALQAHLHHGKRDEGEEQDYLGACLADEEL